MGTHNSLQPIVLISVVLVLWLGTSCARADGSNPTTVSALEALLGSTVEEEPKVFFDDFVYLQFTKGQLSDFLRCLCNKTSFPCQLTYGKAQHSDLKYEIHAVDHTFRSPRRNLPTNPTFVCSTFLKSFSETNITCSISRNKIIPSANSQTLNDRPTRGCDFNCINLKWTYISTGRLNDAKDANVVYKGFGNGPQNSAGEFCVKSDEETDSKAGTVGDSGGPRKGNSNSTSSTGISSRIGSQSGNSSRNGSQSGNSSRNGSQSGNSSRIGSQSGNSSRNGSQSGSSSQRDSKNGRGRKDDRYINSEDNGDNLVGSGSGIKTDTPKDTDNKDDKQTKTNSSSKDSSSTGSGNRNKSLSNGASESESKTGNGQNESKTGNGQNESKTGSGQNDSKTRKDKSSDGSFPDDGTVYNNTANSGDKGHKSSDMDNKDHTPKSSGNKHDNYKESDNKGNVPQGNRNKDDGLADKDNEDNSSTIDGIKDDDNNDNILTDNSHQHDTYSDKESKIDDSLNKSGKDDVSTQKGSKDKDVSTASVVAGIQDEKFDCDSKDRGVVGNQRQESSQVKPFTFGTKFLILTIACWMSVLFNIFCCVFLVSTRSRNRNSEGERPKHSSNEEAKGVENLMYVGHENKEFLNYVPGQASRDSSEGENDSNPTTAETSISGMNFVNNGFNTNEIVPSPRQLRPNRSHQLANPGGVLNFRDLPNKRTSGKSRSAPCPEPSIPLYGNVNDSNMNGDAMSKEQISLYSLTGENLYDTPLNRREHPKSPNCSRPRLNTPPRESNQSSSDIYWRTLNQDGSNTGAGSEYVVADTNDVIPTYDDEEPRRKRRDSEPKIKFVACNATVVDANVDGLYCAPISYEVDELYSEI